PDAGPRAGGLNPARAVAVQFHRIGAAQEVVLLHTLGESRRQFAFARNVRGAFQLLFDTVSDGHFLGVDFQAGQLLIGLIDDSLEILVTRTQGVGFAPEGVVIGNLPRHARVSGDYSEHRETAE